MTNKQRMRRPPIRLHTSSIDQLFQQIIHKTSLPYLFEVVLACSRLQLILSRNGTFGSKPESPLPLLPQRFPILSDRHSRHTTQPAYATKAPVLQQRLGISYSDDGSCVLYGSFLLVTNDCIFGYTWARPCGTMRSLFVFFASAFSHSFC